MNFQTIVKRRLTNQEQPFIIHGQLLEQNGNWFRFKVVYEGVTQVWDCSTDYWDLIE